MDAVNRRPGYQLPGISRRSSVLGLSPGKHHHLSYHPIAPLHRLRKWPQHTLGPKHGRSAERQIIRNQLEHSNNHPCISNDASAPNPPGSGSWYPHFFSNWLCRNHRYKPRLHRRFASQSSLAKAVDTAIYGESVIVPQAWCPLVRNCTASPVDKN